MFILVIRVVFGFVKLTISYRVNSHNFCFIRKKLLATFKSFFFFGSRKI